MSFTTFAFDGLRKTKRRTRKGNRRPTSGSRKSGRIKKGRTRSKERVCGCEVVYLPRGVRGGGKKGKQPALQCEGTPMVKYIPREAVGEHRRRARSGKGLCTTMLKPLK